MKIQKLIGYNPDELLFEEVNLAFLVHKSLIDESTRNMLLKYIKSLKNPSGVNVEIRDNVHIFSPVHCDKDDPDENMSNYLWYAL